MYTSRHTLTQQFLRINANRSGFCEPAELARIFQQANLPLAPEQVREIPASQGGNKQGGGGGRRRGQRAVFSNRPSEGLPPGFMEQLERGLAETQQAGDSPASAASTPEGTPPPVRKKLSQRERKLLAEQQKKEQEEGGSSQ